MNNNDLGDGIWHTALSGLWALGGAIMHGRTDWRDPQTGKAIPWRIISGLVTALVIGEIAAGVVDYLHIAPQLLGGVAAVLGYLGPAGTIGLLERFFPGGKGESHGQDGK